MNFVVPVEKTNIYIYVYTHQTSRQKKSHTPGGALELDTALPVYKFSRFQEGVESGKLPIFKGWKHLWQGDHSTSQNISFRTSNSNTFEEALLSQTAQKVATLSGQKRSNSTILIPKGFQNICCSIQDLLKKGQWSCSSGSRPKAATAQVVDAFFAGSPNHLAICRHRAWHALSVSGPWTSWRCRCFLPLPLALAGAKKRSKWSIMARLLMARWACTLSWLRSHESFFPLFLLWLLNLAKMLKEVSHATEFMDKSPLQFKHCNHWDIDPLSWFAGLFNAVAHLKIWTTLRFW